MEKGEIMRFREAIGLPDDYSEKITFREAIGLPYDCLTSKEIEKIRTEIDWVYTGFCSFREYFESAQQLLRIFSN